MKIMKLGGLVLAASIALSATAVQGQMKAPFGNKDDTTYAAALWAALEKDRMVGANGINMYEFR